MSADQLIGQLEEQYGSDHEFFELLSSWYANYGAADKAMIWLGYLDRLFGTRFHYYGSADVLIVARKPE